MSTVDAKLAELFGRKTVPPPAPAAPSRPASPSPPSRPASSADFFAKLGVAKAANAIKPIEPTIDVRAAASAALQKTGFFDPVAATPEPGLAELLARSPAPAPTFGAPSGLFKKIASAGKKKADPAPRVIKAGAKSLKDIFGLDAEPEFHPNSKIAEVRRQEGVAESSELNRIVHIPRRRPALETAPDLTEEFRRPGSDKRLWPIQSAALHVAREADGLLAAAGVGAGKTLISLLLAAAMKASRAVILVPPGLRSQLLSVDIPFWNKHFFLPLDRFRIVAYSMLSNAKSADVLEDIKPDLIIADEAHNLRHRTAARTKRFLRYMKENPQTRFAGMSGTLTRKSLKDYGHLSELALRKNSPLPVDFPTLTEWAEAIDVSDDPRAPGALLKLCNGKELDEIADLASKKAEDFDTQKVIRKAFQRRLVESPGVVATEEGAVDASLNIAAIRPIVPEEIQRKIKTVLDTWEIDGDELVDPIAVARVVRQLAAGFRYRWVWPNNQPDEEWLSARKEWNRAVREILKRSKKGLDSPMLIASAAERGDLNIPAYEAWRLQKHKPVPPTEAVWISDFLVDHAIRWARENATKTNPLIVWYTHACVGEKIATVGGFPFFGPGSEASEQIIKQRGDKTPIIVASVHAHGTGKNLQSYSQNLFTTPMSGGVEWEQTLGRTHRPGQEADEVNAYVYAHTFELEGAFRNAVHQAEYTEQTLGQRQKLLYAEKIGFKKDAFVFTKDAAPETEGIEWTGSNLAELLRASIRNPEPEPPPTRAGA